MDFNLLDVSYSYLHFNPNSKAKYGLGIGIHTTNFLDGVFFLNYINKYWYNREFIDIGICTSLPIPENYLEDMKLNANYIVKCEQDRGKELGTMDNLNGAFFPSYQNESVKTITHVDGDEIILNAQYFFGNAIMLLDSNKAILNTQETFYYDQETMTERPAEYNEAWKTKFNHLLIINKERVPFETYYPIKCYGDFHSDLYRHFIDSGYTMDDVLLLKRKVFNCDMPTNFLHGFNFQLGMVHATNQIQYPETEDRKIRILRLHSDSIWEDNSVGAHRWWDEEKGLKPPYKGYNPKLYSVKPKKDTYDNR